jgi:hypothetical protein
MIRTLQAIQRPERAKVSRKPSSFAVSALSEYWRDSSGNFSARMTQIIKLLDLAPDIQVAAELASPV